MRSFINKELYLGSQDELINLIVTNAHKKMKTPYYAINADTMLTYWKDQEYQNIINEQQNVVYVDGMGVIYAQKLLQLPYAQERIATTDLFPALVKRLDMHHRQLRIFLLGGKGDTAERVRNNFKNQYDNVQIVGTHHGYFNKIEESDSIINLINSLDVHILFVGFGNPVQEKWVHKYFDALQVNAVITCGGLFDYYSNNVKRAPLVWQKMGFEWLYRLIQEPRRLYRRYVYGNINYLMKVVYLKLRS